jgi:AraC-like DNA-binding protein
MQRAVKLFLFEERRADFAYAGTVWRTRSVPAESFISVAVPYWEFVITRQDGRAVLTVRGPETRASIVAIPQSAEFFGVRFPLGTFMPSLMPGRLRDSSLTLPQSSRQAFRLNGSAWDLPDYDNVEFFVARLVREGLLVRDPVVEAALRDEETRLSLRTVQRRVLRATGLSMRAIRQIERAGRATVLLDAGRPIQDAVEIAGYSDQPHLTRALKRFTGQTPAEVKAMSPAELS